MKVRVFVSSVQKELEDERLIVQNLVNTDPFLLAHCIPVLYELEPASPDKALEGCLKALDTCQIYLLIVAVQYGNLVGDLSITHAEYRRAKTKKLPVLAFIKGDRNLKREERTDALLKELDDDGPKYKRFGNVIELQKEVRAALVKLLKDRHGIVPSSDENEIAQQTIEATSTFESRRSIAFIDRNTRHPMKVVGLNRVRLDEYPNEALREALVNAVAHRQYEDAGRKIMLEVFSDRVVVSSPGLPPAPITLASLRKGKYRPCSRNPVLAQCLSYFHRIEERGSGFRRMRDLMLNHGLDQPLLGIDTGYFQVTFPGPGDDIDRIRVPETRLVVTPAVEALLNDRQKRILAHVLEAGEVTSGWCVKQFGIAYDTASRDLKALAKMKVLVRTGHRKASKYILPEKQTRD